MLAGLQPRTIEQPLERATLEPAHHDPRLTTMHAQVALPSGGIVRGFHIPQRLLLSVSPFANMV